MTFAVDWAFSNNYISIYLTAAAALVLNVDVQNADGDHTLRLWSQGPSARYVGWVRSGEVRACQRTRIVFDEHLTAI